MHIQCWCCSLTLLLIGFGGVWPWKQHQILIVNPQARVSLKHLVCSVEIYPPRIHFHQRCNSLTHVSLDAFSDVLYLSSFGTIYMDLRIRNMITLIFCCVLFHDIFHGDLLYLFTKTWIMFYYHGF